MRKQITKDKINHVVFVVDESSSMGTHRNDVVKVVDQQVAHLARRSQELDQETRVSVYTFGTQVPDPIFYDKDVLRLPSIAQHYQPSGMTALIDATVKSLDDLAQTAQLYGDHAFLVFVVTDGEENASRYNSSYDLQAKLKSLPPEWTVAVLVPNMFGKHAAQDDGFAPENIAIWDPNSTKGVEAAGRVVQQATEDWMVGRARGVRGTNALFSTGADAVNRQTVQSNLTPMNPRDYDVIPVHREDYIRPYVESRGLHYTIGKAYYQLTKTERIQAGKEVAIREKRTGKFYTGRAARDLLGLPAMEVKVKPDYNPEYDVFVQSTSVNRKLVMNTDLLVLR